jgi:hypothetical protein
MLRSFVLPGITGLFAGLLWGEQVLLPGSAVGAEIPLERATVQSLRNTVYLLLQNQPSRPAQIQDAMNPGDALSTAKAALAELRFNDGSLARIGERTLFRFIPRTRTFRLNNGTILLLIPPGRGRTQIQTPNAAAGVRGSALFVRYISETDTTIVGALTTSGIEVANRDRSQNLNLNGGQMAVIVRDRIVQVYNFDLREFYQTSGITRQLALAPGTTSAPASPELAAVQTEAIAAVNAQPPVVRVTSNQASAFLHLSTSGAPASLPQRSAPAPVPSPVSPPQAIIMQRTTPASLMFPPTFALPNQPGGSGVVRNPERSNGAPPGQAGNAPGLVRNNPGRGNGEPPGRGGNTPGQPGDDRGRDD